MTFTIGQLIKALALTAALVAVAVVGIPHLTSHGASSNARPTPEQVTEKWLNGTPEEHCASETPRMLADEYRNDMSFPNPPPTSGPMQNCVWMERRYSGGVITNLRLTQTPATGSRAAVKFAFTLSATGEPTERRNGDVYLLKTADGWQVNEVG
jgi:hypothetical protein